MNHRLVVIHDRAAKNAPSYLPALSPVVSVLAVNIASTARFHDHVDTPWLIDIETVNTNKVSRLKAAMAGRGGAPRLVVVASRGHPTMTQAQALGATAVVPKPVLVETILHLLDTHRQQGCRPNKIRTSRHTRNVPQRFAPLVTPLRSKAAWWIDEAAVTAASHSIAEIADVFDRLFWACAADEAILEKEVREPAAAVSSIIRPIGLAPWLDFVLNHHMATYRHALLVMAVAVGFGLRLALPQQDIGRLALGGLLHDLGKCWVPEPILSKPGSLTEEELAIMRRHPRDGWSALHRAGLPLGEAIYDMVLHHHELLDGSGYPDGLVGDAIPLLTRVLTISDIYRALSETRSYRPAMPRREVMAILWGMAEAGKIDASLLDILAKAVASCQGTRRSHP